MNITNKKHIVVFVDFAPKQAMDTVRENIPGCKILILRDIKHKSPDNKQALEGDYVEYVDFTKPDKIAKALLPYQENLLVITARGESGASRLGEVVPHVPYLRTPTTASLRWATDKYQMRKRFRLYDETITPRFSLVKNATKTERERIIEKVGFPMVVKPASLEGSKLVTICYHEEELDKALRSVFRKLKKEYKKSNRLQVPAVLAEGFMEGEMFSVDSYVSSRGKIWHCPLVKIKTGKDIGHDDFYNYLRITPTNLKKESVEKARLVAEKAIHALGLRNVTAHVELIRMDDEWMVIEVGPRIGGFRQQLHELSCGLDHSLNDVYVRIPKKPVIPKKCQGFAATIRYFPNSEGYIQKINGIKKIRSVGSFHSINLKLKVGSRVVYSKNGGKGVFDLTLFNQERSKLLADIRRVEKLIDVKVSSRRVKLPNSKKAVLKSKSKTVKKR